jgi:hypothetical protein
MSTSRLITSITLVLAFVTCVAALLVVPEARCMIGLEPGNGLHCAPREAIPVATGAGGSVESLVGRIRTRFNEVEREMGSNQLASSRREIAGVAADSAYATIYTLGNEIPKIRARVYSGLLRTSYQAYYADGGLVFVYRTTARTDVPGAPDMDEQRFYFAGGRMIRWLQGNGERPVAPSSAEFVDAEQRIRAIGDGLMRGATSPDAVIQLSN